MIVPALAAVVLMGVVASTPPPPGGADYAHFDSPHVRPAALTPSGDRLLVVNTPDGRLSVFDVTGVAAVRVADLAVGLEPVSVAALTDSVAWVVNRLSDDVSVVDLTAMHVRATLRVGDEPGDVVFAGAPTLAYVSVSMEDAVKVYDPANLAAAPTVIPMPGRMPRALARDAAGSRVWVAVMQGGNRTSVLSAAEAQGGLPAPNPPMAPGLPAAPDVGLVIQQDVSGDWRDGDGQLWNHRAGYSVPDADLVEIDTGSQAVNRTFSGLATLNFGLAVNPVSGTVALSGTEARNLVRFAPNLVGHVVDTRVAFVTTAGASTVRLLNPHINYDVPAGGAAERDSALALPTGVAWSADGARAYVTALGSDRIALLDPVAAPSGLVLARRPVVAGPTGVVVDGARGRLYVVGRSRNQLQTLAADNLSSIAITRIGYDPTPDAVVNGRKFFYQGSLSAHGDQACASCHAFGDADGLAWDLGDPTGAFEPVPPAQLDPFLGGFHPMKGPMVTPALRWAHATERQQWRGDLVDFRATGDKFVSLLGRASAPPDSELAALQAFVTALASPPNPRQRLDRAYPDAPAGQPSALRGRNLFLNRVTDGTRRCVDCHSRPDGGRSQVVADVALGISQDMRIPPLTNLHRKTGFVDLPGATSRRGFGYLHDGSTDDLADLLREPAFASGPTAEEELADLVAFLLAFDTGTAPAVGRQLTFDGSNGADPAALALLDTLRARAAAADCDLIATGLDATRARSWLYQPLSGDWLPDRVAEAAVSTATLLGGATANRALTVTGVPPGSGFRMAIDRDRDTYRSGDELVAGSDPGDPASTPLTLGVEPGAGLAIAPSLHPNPFQGSLEIRFALAGAGPVTAAVYDVLGRRVRWLAQARRFEAGLGTLAWDGRRADGRPVAAGIYFVRVETAAGRWTRSAVRLR